MAEVRTCQSCGGVIGRDCWNPQECAEITAQMNAQPAAAWQPIETAPRDGSTFLAYNPMLGIYTTAYTVRWTGDPEEYRAWMRGEPSYEGFPCGFHMSSLGSWPFGQWDCQPTHWMPIPKAPR